jgi:hypothetical protein
MRAWTFLTVPQERRQFRGNTGYADEPESVYLYDSTVPNHGAVTVGDLAVVRDREFALGMGWIERVTDKPAAKDRLRCPVCGITAIRERKAIAPRFRCNVGHLFDKPIRERIAVTQFAAHYGRTWRLLDGLLDARALRPLYFGQAAQHAIREIHADKLQLALLAQQLPLTPEWWTPPPANGKTSSAPLPAGWREGRTRMRIGQDRFRKALLSRFGSVCALTGPQPPEVLEAAHLYRYAGNGHHDIDGGLLFRRDLHALFDDGLLLINTDKWNVAVCPDLRVYPAYAALDGIALAVPTSLRPSARYLKSHAEQARSTWL